MEAAFDQVCVGSFTNWQFRALGLSISYQSMMLASSNLTLCKPTTTVDRWSTNSASTSYHVMGYLKWDKKLICYVVIVITMSFDGWQLGFIRCGAVKLVLKTQTQTASPALTHSVLFDQHSFCGLLFFGVLIVLLAKQPSGQLQRVQLWQLLENLSCSVAWSLEIQSLKPPARCSSMSFTIYKYLSSCGPDDDLTVEMRCLVTCHSIEYWVGWMPAIAESISNFRHTTEHFLLIFCCSFICRTQVLNVPPKQHHPVILCPGLGSSGAYSFDLSPNVSLADYLAGKGWDVWTCELRGEYFTKFH